MAIALVGTPTTAAGASTTATTAAITVPTGSTGDMLLIGVSVASNGSNGSTAPLITASSANTVQVGFIPAGWVSAALFYRVVQAGDPTSYTFTTNTGAPISVACVRYSGVDTTNPFRHWNLIGEFRNAATTTTSHTFPVSENVQSTDVTVVFAAMGTPAKTTSNPVALSTPAGWTSVVAGSGATGGSSYHTVNRFYSEVAGVDTPTVTGGTGQYGSLRVVLVDSANPVPDAVGGAITFVDASTATTVATGATSVSINKPATVVDGNVMLLVAGQSIGYALFTPPAGWVSVGMGSGRANMGTSSPVADIVAQVWYKFASSEPSSYSVSVAPSSQEQTLAIVAYSGVRNPYPIKLAAVTNSTAAASTTGVAPYVLPQVSSDNLVVNLYVAGGDSTGAFTMTGPSSPWNQRAQAVSAVTTDFNAGVTVADKLAASDQPAATVSNTATWTTVSLSLVGAPVVASLLWKPRLGPNYRR